MAIFSKEQKPNEAKDTPKVDIDSSKLETNADKAKFIYSMRYSQRALSTLERLSAQELDFILENKRDPEAGEFDKNNVKFARELVNNFINGLAAIKEARNGEKINEPAKRFTLAQADILAPFLNSAKAGVVGICFLVFGLVFLCADSIIGFENIKNYFKKRTQGKINAPATTQNQQNNIH